MTFNYLLKFFNYYRVIVLHCISCAYINLNSFLFLKEDEDIYVLTCVSLEIYSDVCNCECKYDMKHIYAAEIRCV